MFERTIRVLSKPGFDCVGEIVFADESLTDNVGVCEGRPGMSQKVGKVEVFVRRDLHGRYS